MCLSLRPKRARARARTRARARARPRAAPRMVARQQPMARRSSSCASSSCASPSPLTRPHFRCAPAGLVQVCACSRQVWRTCRLRRWMNRPGASAEGRGAMRCLCARLLVSLLRDRLSRATLAARAGVDGRGREYSGAQSAPSVAHWRSGCYAKAHVQKAAQGHRRHS